MEKNYPCCTSHPSENVLDIMCERVLLRGEVKCFISYETTSCDDFNDFDFYSFLNIKMLDNQIEWQQTVGKMYIC